MKLKGIQLIIQEKQSIQNVWYEKNCEQIERLQSTIFDVQERSLSSSFGCFS